MPNDQLARFTRLVLFLAAALAAAVVVYVVARLMVGTAQLTLPVLIAFLCLPLALATVLAIAAQRSPDARLSGVLMLAATTVAIYAFEIHLETADKTWPVRGRAMRAARAAGRPFDGRRGLELVDSLRTAGIRAYPAMFGPAIAMGRLGNMSLNFVSGTDTVLPLASLPHRVTVYCNESGRYNNYQSDSLGFNNSDESWSDHTVDAVVIGDSFVAGACVPRDSDLVAALRSRGLRAVNLGVGGSGPVAELARLREYAAPRKPHVVLWVYTEGNDFQDLSRELRNPLLRRYLDPAFTQHLTTNHAQMESAFEARLDSALTQHRLSPSFSQRLRAVSVRDVILLQSLRDNLLLPSLATGARREVRCCDVASYDFRAFERILRQANAEVAAWGGRLVFVVIPDNSHFFLPDGRFCRPCALSPYLDSLNTARHRGIDVAHSIGLPVVDLHGPFLAQAAIAPFFQFAGSHFNPAGYRLAAETVVGELQQAHLVARTDSAGAPSRGTR